MPAARGQAAEQRCLGGFAIEVKSLRIELRRKRHDLRCIDRVLAARKALPYAQVFEEKPVRRRAGFGHRSRSRVTCMMIITRLYRVNAAQELWPDDLPDCPQSRACGRVVEHSYSSRCSARTDPVRSVPEESRDRAQHADAPAQCAGGRGIAAAPALQRTAAA